jgi:ribosomal protein S24E
MYYKLILETGHVGAGKSLEKVKYFQGGDILTVFEKAHSIPRVKKKEHRRGILFIQQISRWEYEKGLRRY